MSLRSSGLRSLANDDFRAVKREVVDLHIEAPTVAVDPSSAYRLPATAITVLGHGVDPVARAVVCLAHVMFLSSWFETSTLRGFVGHKGPRGKAARSKAARRAPRSGAELAARRRRPKRAALKAMRARA